MGSGFGSLLSEFPQSLVGARLTGKSRLWVGSSFQRLHRGVLGFPGNKNPRAREISGRWPCFSCKSRLSRGQDAILRALPRISEHRNGEKGERSARVGAAGSANGNIKAENTDMRNPQRRGAPRVGSRLSREIRHGEQPTQTADPRAEMWQKASAFALPPCERSGKRPFAWACISRPRGTRSVTSMGPPDTCPIDCRLVPWHRGAAPFLQPMECIGGRT